jgi:hypothetical protein
MTENIETFNLTDTAHDTVASGPDGDLSSEKLDAVDRDLKKDELCGKKFSELRLISEQRVKEENLEWVSVPCGDNVVLEEIVDADGVVYNAILRADGRVDDGFVVWDSPRTFERFGEEAVKPVAHTHIGHWTIRLLWNRETNEFFCDEYHNKVFPSESVMSVPAEDVARWFVDLTEYTVIEWDQTGHLCFRLPGGLIDQIREVAWAERRSYVDWIIDCLSEHVREEKRVLSERAKVAVKVPSPPGAKAPSTGKPEEVGEILERIRRANAAERRE